MSGERMEFALIILGSIVLFQQVALVLLASILRRECVDFHERIKVLEIEKSS